MTCAQARRLFGAYWDDDSTQAERESVESHFSGCTACRREYEAFSRVLELAGSLPRIEASPDFLDQTLARARRATPEADQVSAPGVRWVPVTAGAAAVLVLAALISPWLGVGTNPRTASRGVPAPAIREAQLVRPRLVNSADGVAGTPRARREALANGAVAAATDSLFDHSEDVEFILDPVTVRRGRATMTRQPTQVQGERAVITF